MRFSWFAGAVERWVTPYLKAHAAGIGAGLVMLMNDLNGNINNVGHLQGSDWAQIIGVTGLLGSFVALLPWKPNPLTPAGAPAAAMFAPAPAAPAVQDEGDAAPPAPEAPAAA